MPPHRPLRQSPGAFARERAAAHAATDWRSEDSLPRHDGSGWSLWKGHPVSCTNAADVLERLRRWNPTSTVLVAAPGQARHVPPPASAVIGERVFARFRRQARTMLAMVWVGAALFAAIAVVAMRRVPFAVAVIVALVAALATLDHRGTLASRDGAAERVRYTYWLMVDRDVRRGVVAWVVVCVVAGAIEAALVARDGYASAIMRWGLWYPAARGGEWWRLATGPWLHASIAHFANNAFTTVAVGAMAWPVYRWRAMVVFVVAASLAGAMQMTWGDARVDSFTGTSGGVFALFALMVVHGLRRPGALPRGLTPLLAGIGALSAVGAVLLSPDAAIVAHAVGFAVGAAAGVFEPSRGRAAAA